MLIEEIIASIINKPNTYVGEAPIDIDDCIWVRTNSGGSQVSFGKDTYDKANYNVLVRNMSNEQAKKNTDEIYHTLQNYVGANYVILIQRLPRFVGRDIKYRSVYTISIQFQLGGY